VIIFAEVWIRLNHTLDELDFNGWPLRSRKRRDFVILSGAKNLSGFDVQLPERFFGEKHASE